MVSAGMKVIKYLLFFFNLIFWITGVAILSIGIYVQVKSSHFFMFVGTGFVSAPILLIAIGSIITVIAFFGCCGAVKESHCMMITFSVFLGIIFILELAAGIAAYVMRKDLQETIDKNMNEAIDKYGDENYPTLTKGMDALQHDISCCGFNNSTDWVKRGKEVPQSCCIEDKEGCNKGPTPIFPPGTLDPRFFKDGCFDKFANQMKNNIGLVGGVGVGIAFVQIIGIVCACCLASAIKREYEVV